jgi:Tc5 transposase DNA-binding domain
MPKSTASKSAEIEARVQQAIDGLKSEQFPSLRKAAAAFQVPVTTLQARMNGRKSRSSARESQQNLYPTEETTLKRWITRLTRTGFKASPQLVMKMADEIRRGRGKLSRTVTTNWPPIGHNWLDRFRRRHPEIQGIWTRQIERARFNAVTQETAR